MHGSRINTIGFGVSPRSVTVGGGHGQDRPQRPGIVYAISHCTHLVVADTSKLKISYTRMHTNRKATAKKAPVSDT